MKKIIAIALISLTSGPAFSAPAKHFYECEGLAGVDEYRVGINLTSKRAGFFDNDSVSYMKLTATEITAGRKPQTVMTFEGKEASYDGSLRLYFNLTKKTAALYSIGKPGESTEVGSANCVNAEPWEDLN